MQLVWFEIHGFRRFREKSKVNLDSKLVAFVGPNEAGKTSLLAALLHFNSSGAFANAGPSQQTTRGAEFDANHVVIEATYALDGEDRKSLVEVPEASAVRWFVIRKNVNGQITTSMTPRPARNLEPRKQSLRALSEKRVEVERILLNAQEAGDTDAEGVEGITLDVDRLAQILEGEEQTIDTSSIDYIRHSADAVRDLATQDASLMGMANSLHALADHEAREHPNSAARKLLSSRLPRFLLFDDANRLLQSDYNLDNFFRAKRPEAVPKHLQNMANACELDLKELFRAQQTGDEGTIETVLEAANNRLKTLVESSWSQSEITVRLRLNQTILHVLVNEKQGQFVRLAERSDGLRQFVALLVFLTETPDLTEKPVLLIDETERHLHYDAQADLVQMLARQDVARKVVYTTHSIGCLPEDLGSGVRLVETDGANSHVVNWFWENDRPGFSRLLFGMGASTLAFIPVRYAVVTEGASDLLLLPALLKEATQRDYLGFQVAPGLASATKGQIAVVDNESPRTVHLTDGDEGGDSIRAKIKSAGVSKGRIMRLECSRGVVIEDFVKIESYVDAVNEELRRSHGDEHQIDARILDETNRPFSVKNWCLTRGINAPSKRSVAYRLLDQRRERALLREDVAEDLRNLYQRIVAALEIGTGQS